MADPSNPYAPPQSADLGGPPPLPPLAGGHTSVPKIFGVLSIIFASVIGLGGLLFSCSLPAAGFMGAAGNGMSGEKLDEMRPMMQAMKAVYTGIGIQGVIFLGMSIWLLVLGIGQMRYRSWACRQSVTWGLAALIALGAMVVLSLVVIGPAYKQMFEAIAHAAPHTGTELQPMKMPSGMGMMLGGTMSAFLVFIYAPYPILMIAMFTREHVRAAMTS
ncbi:MAG TPA: hypothetical protein VFF06_22715 [Polyangia bacterium]|nr:hypothetical protein [Polyangia bacterium]